MPCPVNTIDYCLQLDNPVSPDKAILLQYDASLYYSSFVRCCRLVTDVFESVRRGHPSKIFTGCTVILSYAVERIISKSTVDLSCATITMRTSHHHITSSRRMQAYWPLYPTNTKTYMKSINNLMQLHCFRYHEDLHCNCTLHLDHTNTYQDDV